MGFTRSLRPRTIALALVALGLVLWRLAAVPGGPEAGARDLGHAQVPVVVGAVADYAGDARSGVVRSGDDEGALAVIWTPGAAEGDSFTVAGHPANLEEGEARSEARWACPESGRSWQVVATGPRSAGLLGRALPLVRCHPASAP